MDGRGALKLSVLVLMAAGCQHQVMTLPNPGSLSSADKAAAIDRAQIKTAPAKSKNLPPLVWVSAGDYKAGEAARAADALPDQRQQMRDRARADYEQALKIDPKCVPAYQGLARLYSAMRDMPLAVETYHKALKIAPNNAALWYDLAMCHHTQKNVGPALECLSRASKIDPGNRTYINAMGVMLAEAGRYEESVNCFSRSGGEALGYYRLARTLERLQRPELSRRYLAAALEKDPSLASTLAASKSAAPAVQQTAYQAPASQSANVCAAPAAPAPPRVISLQASQKFEPPQQAGNVSAAPAAAAGLPRVISREASPKYEPPQQAGAVSVAPAAADLPQVISREASQEYEPQQQVLVPPTPAINEPSEQPQP